MSNLPFVVDNDAGDNVVVGGVPMFNKHGTALSREERLRMAQKKGICVDCGIKTHEVKNIVRRVAIDSVEVYKGTCVRCNKDRVPPHVYHRWEEVHCSSSITGSSIRMQKAVTAVRATNTLRRAVAHSSSRAEPQQQQAVVRSGGGPAAAAALLSSLPRQGSGRSNVSGTSSSMDESMDFGQLASHSPRSRSPDDDSRAEDFAASMHHTQHLNPARRSTRDDSSSIHSNPEHTSERDYLSLIESKASGEISPPKQRSSRSLGSNSSYSQGGGSRGYETQQVRVSRSLGEFTAAHCPNEQPWQVVKTIKENHNNPEILMENLHRLRNLHQDRGGAMEEVRKIMEAYWQDPRMLILCCGALWGITALDDDKKEQAAEDGIIDMIIDVIRQSRTVWDEDVYQWAVGTLAGMARGYDCKSRIANAGGIEIILDVLGAHGESPGVFEWSCRALHALVHQYEDEDGVEKRAKTEAIIRKNITSVLEVDGAATIVKTMKLHPTETVAQGWAAKLLLRLLDQKSNKDFRTVVGKVVQADALGSCLKVLKARSTTPEVIVLTLELMTSLIPERSSDEFPYDCGECIATTARVMKEHSNVESVLEACCRLLACLARTQHLEEMKDFSVTERIVEAMSMHITNLSLQEAAVWALWNMSFVPSCFDDSSEKQALQTLRESTRIFPDAAILHAGACGLIANLSLLPNTNMADFPVEIAFEAMLLPVRENFASLLYEEASRACANICIHAPEKMEPIIGRKEVAMMVKTIERPFTKAVGPVCSVLAAVAGTNEENGRFLVRTGCLDAALNLMKTVEFSSISGEATELLCVLVHSTTMSSSDLPRDFISAVVRSSQVEPDTDVRKESAFAAAISVLSSPSYEPTDLDVHDLMDLAMEVLNSNTATVELKTAACKTIWVFVATRSRHVCLPLSSVFRVIAEVMGAYRGEEKPFESDLQASAAGALASVANAMEAPVEVSSESMDMVVAVMYVVMERDSQRTELLDNFLSVLLHLCSHDEEVVIESGGILVTIDALLEHGQHSGVQEKGCAILGILCSGKNVHVNQTISETDGIDAIMSAFTHFPQNASIQANACKCLAHLSVDNQSRKSIVLLGGLSQLVHAMTTFRDNIDLVADACSALLNLSSDADEATLSEANVVGAVIELLHHHPDIDSLHETGLGVLQNLSRRSKNMKRIISDAGGFEVAVTTLRTFMGSPRVLERTFSTIWSLSLLDQNREAVGQEVVDLVLNSMIASATDVKVQKQACGCICALASVSRTKIILRDAGAADAILFAMWCHYGSESLQAEACRAFAVLAFDTQTNEVMLANDGEISSIVSAMRHFPNSAKVQKHATTAIRNLVLATENAELIQNTAEELTELLFTATNKFPEDCADSVEHILTSL